MPKYKEGDLVLVHGGRVHDAPRSDFVLRIEFPGGSRAWVTSDSLTPVSDPEDHCKSCGAGMSAEDARAYDARHGHDSPDPDRFRWCATHDADRLAMMVASVERGGSARQRFGDHAVALVRRLRQAVRP